MTYGRHDFGVCGLYLAKPFFPEGVFTLVLGWLIFPVCQPLFLVSAELPLLAVLHAQLTESSNWCCSTPRGIQDSQGNLSCLGVFMMWELTEQGGGDREQPMALLKLQLWGWQWERAAPQLPWAVSRGLDACNQYLKGPVGSGLGTAGLMGLFK